MKVLCAMSSKQPVRALMISGFSRALIRSIRGYDQKLPLLRNAEHAVLTGPNKVVGVDTQLSTKRAHSKTSGTTCGVVGKVSEQQRFQVSADCVM